MEHKLLDSIAGGDTLRENISRVGEGRHPATILVPRIPTDMVDMHMRADYEVNVVWFETAGVQSLQIGHRKTMGEHEVRPHFMVADAGIDR